MRGILARLLAKHGAEVLVASCASEALFLLASSDDGAPRRTLALLDVLVPGVDGQMFVQALRADHRFASAPIVLLSGLSAAALDQTAASWNADGYVMKTRGIIQVGEELGQWLARLEPDRQSLHG